MFKTGLITLVVMLFSGCANGGSGSGLNECGGVEDLNIDFNELCGDCGTWKCDGPEAVSCDDPGTNECHGCSELEHPIGQWCGECRSYVCDGAEGVVCADTGPNDCGGCSELPHPIDSFCGSCGKYQCDGDNDVQCIEGAPNDCGGCFPLADPVGSACGTCGSFICNPSDSEDTICNEVINGCGGCDVLIDDVGDTCGDCGEYICGSTENSTVCEDPGFNVCDGCAELPGGIGGPCACGDGSLSCDGQEDMLCTVTVEDGYTSRNNLGNFEDSDDTIYTEYNTLDPTFDTEDWYESFVEDTWTGDMDIRAWLDNIPAGHNYDLCVYYNPGVESEVDCVSGSDSTHDGNLGCCSTLPGIAGEYVELSVNAVGTIDEDGFFYYHINFISGPGSCDEYIFSYAF